MKNYARTDLACESMPCGIRKGVFDGVLIDLDTWDGVEIIKTEVFAADTSFDEYVKQFEK